MGTKKNSTTVDAAEVVVKAPKLKKNGDPRKVRETRDVAVLLTKAEKLRAKKVTQLSKLDAEIATLRAKIDARANVAAETEGMTQEEIKAQAAALAARAQALRSVVKA